MTDLLGRPVSGEITKTYSDNVEQWSAEEFLKRLDAVLDLPDVEAVKWEQYTPYFNDGEPCVFSVGDVRVKMNWSDGESGDYGDGLYSHYDSELREGVRVVYGEYNQVTHLYSTTEIPTGHGPRTDVVEALKGMKMGHFENVCLDAFGDHAEVTATKDGFEVEYYEHD